MTNLQGLDNNIHLVMCHTNTELVKSNTLAALNPTSAHFLMVPQKDITYYCKNDHPQGRFVLHPAHHMQTVHSK
jgi:hypothetical protein